MILLSLASKQIWQQVLTVSHLRPDRLFLLHSEDANESQGPAQRLKRFFDKTGLIPKGGTKLEPVSDSDFTAIERRLDELQTQAQLPLPDCVLNLTGGNKLMATAAFRWSAKRGVKSFYLERRNRLTWFEPRDGDMHTRTESLSGSLADHLDPVALLRCQLDASEVERPGQVLTLNEAGSVLSESTFFNRIRNGNDARPWLTMSGKADREEKDGDSLEYTAAAVLLKLGVHQVQRSLRLKVKSAHHVATRRPHTEIDLLFIWSGRLWLVDCKDQDPLENLAMKLRAKLLQPLSNDADHLLNRIADELSISQTKALKADLLAVREAGGLLGQIVCVRKSPLPDEVQQFASHHRIEVVAKTELAERLRTLIQPTSPASPDQIRSLVAAFSANHLGSQDR